MRSGRIEVGPVERVEESARSSRGRPPGVQLLATTRSSDANHGPITLLRGAAAEGERRRECERRRVEPPLRAALARRQRGVAQLIGSLCWSRTDVCLIDAEVHSEGRARPGGENGHPKNSPEIATAAMGALIRAVGFDSAESANSSSS